MASCPIKNSIEWKRIMKQAQQNEQRALELWVEEGFAENPDLNEDVESEDEQDAKKADQTQPVVDEEGIEKLMNNLILQLNTRIDIIQKQKSTNEDERLRKLNKLRALLKNIQAAEGVKSILLFNPLDKSPDNVTSSELSIVIAVASALSSIPVEVNPAQVKSCAAGCVAVLTGVLWCIT